MCIFSKIGLGVECHGGGWEVKKQCNTIGFGLMEFIDSHKNIKYCYLILKTKYLLVSLPVTE